MQLIDIGGENTFFFLYEKKVLFTGYRGGFRDREDHPPRPCSGDSDRDRGGVSDGSRPSFSLIGGQLNMASNSYIGERPLGEILQDVMRDLGEVIRGEVRLAKAEMGEKVSQASKSGVLFGGAALCGVMGFAGLVFAAISALSMFVSTWVAALIVGAFLLCIAGAFCRRQGQAEGSDSRARAHGADSQG